MVSRRSFMVAGAAATLGAPAWLLARPERAKAGESSTAAASLPITLRNTSGSDTVYAYISGADESGWPGFVGADGVFRRLPSPSSVLTPVADHSIPLGPSGSSGVRVPLNQYVISGRVWFSVGAKLQFFVNPANGGGAPGMVQPALTASDPNWRTNWTFCEFTYNSANLYANISYVDMVALPVAMSSTGAAGSQSVPPLPAGALGRIAEGLRAQHAADGAPWGRLVATDDAGKVVRVMAPAHSPTGFGDYWQPYLDEVWRRYETTDLTVNGQGSVGKYTGRVSGGVLTFAGLNDNGVPFTRPSAVDIFGCASGPLHNSGGDARGAVAARLAAALNRSSLLVSGGDNQPDGVPADRYYRHAITNHYARLVHEHATIGYAFPYDDVGPTGAPAVDGHLQDGAPTSWTIEVGAGA
ncbi:beta-1,3-glucanase family protein [Streptomyces sp. NPDC002734]|uniref:beta-1,3-glucanase family protein n=1 Tax=Streptomyces sp. NPDC002734 TaxID=3154426 RepID=UPI00332A95B9